MPESVEDLERLIKPLAEEYGEKLDDDFVIEGNSDKTYGQLKELCELSHWNVALDKEELDDAGHISTFYLQEINIPELMKRCQHSGFLLLQGANEVSLTPQGIKFWFD